jgi:hypothetical protein
MRRLICILLFLAVSADQAEAQLLRRLFSRRNRSDPSEYQPPPSYSQPAPQQSYCPTCSATPQADMVVRMPSNYTSPTAGTSAGQAMAQRRVNYMARNRLRGHPPRSAGNFASVGSFEGVGFSSGGGLPPTCVPGRRGGVRDTSSAAYRLVGDATASNGGRNYRCRIWSRQ